jgi:hypothetical protein
VMLGDAQRPAKFSARSFGVRMRHFEDCRCGHAGLAFGAFERVFFYHRFVIFEAARGILDELLIHQPGRNNFAAHRVCQRHIRTHIEAEPYIGPLRRTRAARVDYEKFRAAAQTLQEVMKKNRMGLAGVRAPQKNYIRLFNFAVGAGAPSRTEYRRQTGDAGGVSSAVAAIDVVAADHCANEFLRGVIQFIGRFRATEHSKRARPAQSDFGTDAFGDAIESLFPCRGTMLSIFAD